MQKMMTYSEANSVLGSSLTPNNRCLSKSVAIANDADPDLLANFDNARLVPASVVEPATHWIDEHTVEHYFVDENGNKIGNGDVLNITLPRHGEIIVVRTKALLDGQPFPEYMKGGQDTDDPSHHTPDNRWIDNEGCISEKDYNVHSNNTSTPASRGMIKLANSAGNFVWVKDDSNGITNHVINCPIGYTYENTPGQLVFSICINDDFANPLKINTPELADRWNINLNVDRSNLSYDINRGYVNFENAVIGQETADTHLTGFGDGPNDYEIEYAGYYFNHQELKPETEGKITDVVKNQTGTSFIAIRTGDALIPEGRSSKMHTYNLYKIYKVSDPSVYVYFSLGLDPIDD